MRVYGPVSDMLATGQADELYAQTDLDLGSRQLERFMWQVTHIPSHFLAHTYTGQCLHTLALVLRYIYAMPMYTYTHARTCSF